MSFTCSFTAIDVAARETLERDDARRVRRYTDARRPTMKYGLLYLGFGVSMLGLQLGAMGFPETKSVLVLGAAGTAFFGAILAALRAGARRLDAELTASFTVTMDDDTCTIAWRAGALRLRAIDVQRFELRGDAIAVMRDGEHVAMPFALKPEQRDVEADMNAAVATARAALVGYRDR